MFEYSFSFIYNLKEAKKTYLTISRQQSSAFDNKPPLFVSNLIICRMNQKITITHWLSDRLAAEADLTLLLKCLVTLSEVSEGGRWLKKFKNCPNSTKW